MASRSTFARVPPMKEMISTATRNAMRIPKIFPNKGRSPALIPQYPKGIGRSMDTHRTMCSHRIRSQNSLMNPHSLAKCLDMLPLLGMDYLMDYLKYIIEYKTTQR